jgi:hypothetical protein
MLEKIKDSQTLEGKSYTHKRCSHPEHKPPMHIVLEPGTYKHTCPGCGKVTTFEVPLVTC